MSLGTHEIYSLRLASLPRDAEASRFFCSMARPQAIACKQEQGATRCARIPWSVPRDMHDTKVQQERGMVLQKKKFPSLIASEMSVCLRIHAINNGAKGQKTTMLLTGGPWQKRSGRQEDGQ